MHPYDSHTTALLRSADRAREARTARASQSIHRSHSPAVEAVRRAVGLRLVAVGLRLAAGNAQARAFHERRA